MAHSTNVTEAVRSFQQIKIDGYSAIRELGFVDFRWIVDGYSWRVRFHPEYSRKMRHNWQIWVALEFVLLDEPRSTDVTASISCWLVDPSGNHVPSYECSASNTFFSPQGSEQSQSETVFLMGADELKASGYVVNDSLTVECTITVVKELEGIVIQEEQEEILPVPPSDMTNISVNSCRARREPM